MAASEDLEVALREIFSALHPQDGISQYEHASNASRAAKGVTIDIIALIDERIQEHVDNSPHLYKDGSS